jgi:ankyrin repeat protein
VRLHEVLLRKVLETAALSNAAACARAIAAQALPDGLAGQESRYGYALHIAASCGHVAVLDVLLRHGGLHPDVTGDSRFDSGTALHCAARNGHGGCVDSLLKAGASTTVKNR